MEIKEVIIRCILAVIVGAAIGTERGRHGRAAGMRTHILVCIGATLTAMTGVFTNGIFGGDVSRIAAQVISGIGFLGAGMIILKNGNVISGLTTAAGVWATATIGIALGYGFYAGAIITTALFLITITTFSKLEKEKKHNIQIIYFEINNINSVNRIIDELQNKISQPFTASITPAKSGLSGHVGLQLTLDKAVEINHTELLSIEGISFVVEE